MTLVAGLLVVVRERIPDRLMEEADEVVVVVDVTAETLQERLLDGKIYAPQKFNLSNFFQRRKLIALRELALRRWWTTLRNAIASTPAGAVL